MSQKTFPHQKRPGEPRCVERRPSGSGRGRWKRVYSVVSVQVSQYRAGGLLHVRVRRLKSLVGLQRCPFPNKCEELERQQEPLRIYARESQQGIPSERYLSGISYMVPPHANAHWLGSLPALYPTESMPG
jgi:hypothetical protein